MMLLSCCAGGTVFAQDHSQLEGLVEDAVESAIDTRETREPGNWVWMPTPVLNPTIDGGLAFAALRLYKLDDESPPSTTGAGGFATSNGSKGGGLFSQNYLRNDRVRLSAAAGYADLNLYFYGIGNLGRDREGLKINQEGVFGLGQALWQLRKNLYAGVRLRYLSLKTSLRGPADERPFGLAPEQLLDFGLQLDSIGPGFKLEWDSRDSNWFPTSGQFAQLFLDSSSQTFGASRDYRMANLRWSGYWLHGERDVLALNATACAASENAPFYDICLIGANKNLRGFVTGQYRDRSMLTVQAEYRKQLAESWGVVLFGGLGEVAPEFGQFTASNVRTSAGFGVRWLASPPHGVRLSVDLAWGEGDSAAYFYIGEAF